MVKIQISQINAEIKQKSTSKEIVDLRKSVGKNI